MEGNYNMNININIKLTVEKHKLFNREKINNLRNFELHYPTKTAKLANLTLKRETQKLHLGGRSNMDNTKKVDFIVKKFIVRD